MKKLVSLMLALLLTCMMLPALAEETDVTGEWYLTEYLAGETSMSPAALGMSMTITLNGDGTATIATDYGDGPEPTEGTWTLDGQALTITADDMPMDFLVEEGKLTTDLGGSSLIFGREAPVAEELPQIITAENEEAFFGNWTLMYVGVDGGLLPASAMMDATTLMIEAGKIVMATGEDALETNTEFVEGTLKFVSAQDEEIVLELNDNGWISITYQYGEDTVMRMYFVKEE